MLRAAVLTGLVDFVLPVMKIPAMLARHQRRGRPDAPPGPKSVEARLDEFIDLLRAALA